MALKAKLTTNISQVYSSNNTCFGLPATSGYLPAYCDCNLAVHVAVYDSGNVYVGLNGSVSRDSSIIAADYGVKMCVSPDTWTWSYSNGTAQGPSAAWTATITVGSDGAFNWAFSCSEPSDTEPAGTGYVLVGTLTDFHADTDGTNGYLYLGGTGTYEVTNPIYPTPVQIAVPGFKEYIEAAKSYFPWASYSGTQWDSCNRSGGYVQSYENSAWADKKNSQSGDSTVYYFNGSDWTICPKIGEE